MKHSERRGQVKKGEDEMDGMWAGKRNIFFFSLSFLSHSVCRCYELILLVLGKFNYVQDKTRLNVSV